MLSFDSMKLQASLIPSVSRMDRRNFRISKRTIEDQHGVSVGYDVTTKDILGLKSIRINEEKEIVQIELSGKILGKDYWKLINSDTIIQALDAINQNDCIIIRPEKFLESAIVHSIDVTQDIPVKGFFEVQEVLDALFMLRNKGFTVSPYEKQGIAITKIAKRNNCREVFYNKQDEVLKDKQLCQVCDIGYFEGKIRSELNLRKYEYIRKYLGIEKSRTIPLIQVLKSSKLPNLEFFTEFENPIPSLFEEIDEYKDFRIYQDRKGWETIIKELNFEDNLIMLMLEKFGYTRTSVYKIMREEVRPIKNSMVRNINPKYGSIISHLKAYLNTTCMAM